MRATRTKGWHIYSDTEWTTLTIYLGGEFVTGDKLKETGTTHWTTPITSNTRATNETGFTALPSGYCSSNGVIYEIGYNCSWWGSTEYSTACAYTLNMTYISNCVYKYHPDKELGLSVRCVMDF